MTSAYWNRYLRTMGRPELCISKAGGVYYLLGQCPDFKAHDVERCLHVVRLSDMTEEVIDGKILELIGRVDCEPCGGRGRVDTGFGWLTCDACGGSGTVDPAGVDSTA